MAGTLLGVGIAGDPHEIHPEGDSGAVEGAHQIRGEDETALQQADNQQVAGISFRNIVDAAMKNPTIGFRCAKSI